MGISLQQPNLCPWGIRIGFRNRPVRCLQLACACLTRFSARAQSFLRRARGVRALETLWVAQECEGKNLPSARSLIDPCKGCR